ncbi:MAG: hypothetical protein K2M89_05015 [Clostridiales bacterium]|nr:hypothetical protein [Clostridiales bacterium]
MPNKNKPAKDTTQKSKQTKPAESPRHKLTLRVGKPKAKVKAKSELPNNNTVSENRLELLITTVNRSKGEYYADLIQSFDVNMQFMAMGHGTADAKTLSMFGFTDSDKTVIFSVIQGNKLQAALDALEEKFRTIKNGKGIAYTVPLSGVIGKLIFGFLSNNRSMIAENKEN